ncbi:MAG: hypothetical protein ACI9BW_001034 [Gammaproteobacteria bacterium]|jgi:hypothetical protein
MNWDAIGAVGEVFGAAAVVISLLYLAAQVRTQNRESRLAATHEILEAYRNTGMPFQSSENAQLLTKANRDFESLRKPQRIQIISLTLPVLRLWEEAFYQNRDGRVEDGMWDTMAKVFADVLSTKAFQKVWKLRQSGFSDLFRAHVNTLEAGEWKTK